MDRERVTLHDLVTDAVRAAGGRATTAQIKEYVLSRHTAKPRSVGAAILICTVNAPSRVTYQQNRGVRYERNPKYDTLFRVGLGVYALYKPEEHGRWGIVQEGDGYKIRQLDTPQDLAVVKGARQPSFMSTEREQKSAVVAEPGARIRLGKRVRAILQKPPASGAVDLTNGIARETTDGAGKETTSKGEHTTRGGARETTGETEQRNSRAAPETTIRDVPANKGDRRGTTGPKAPTELKTVDSTVTPQNGKGAGEAGHSPERRTNKGVAPVAANPGAACGTDLLVHLQRDPTILGPGVRRCTEHKTPIQTAYGTIDYLAEDETGTLIVVTEARTNEPSVQALFFALLMWVRANLAPTGDVRGVLVVPDTIDASGVTELFRNSPDARICRLSICLKSLV